MKHIVLFGAGKSSTVLIDYLVAQVQMNPWELTVADHDHHIVEAKLKSAPKTTALGLDVTDDFARRSLVDSANIVISLLPPSLHILVAQDCLFLGKNLLTASYLDPKIRDIEQKVKEKGLLFLCEMGLDPGIDHMSAMELINRIHADGGKITVFKSHCGGLVAPESDDNPWKYKISWNPRNVVMAGKAGADFLEDGIEKHVSYNEVFNVPHHINVQGLNPLSWYPNRDSLSYIGLYKLEGIETFIRTTLRYPEFMFGWNNIINMGLTREDIFYETDSMSLKQFYKEHFRQNGFGEWLDIHLTQKFQQTRELLEKLNELIEAEETAGDAIAEGNDEIMMVNPSGEIKNYNLEKVKLEAAATVAGSMHEAGLTMNQLFYLGMDDDQTLINKGRCSAAEVLQFVLEKKLKLEDHDKDMIVMVHEIEYILNGKNYQLTSSMVAKGEDNIRTAMAKTVGLPLGIACTLILENKLNSTGVLIPTLPEIYEPVLHELKSFDLIFHEVVTEKN